MISPFASPFRGGFRNLTPMRARGRGANVFSPLSLGNVAGWWRASTLGLNDGDAVSSWPDLSGNGKHLTQGTGANQPLYKTATFASGQPVVKFDGSNDLLSVSSLALTQPTTVMVVVRSSTDARFTLDGVDVTNRQRIGVTGGNWFMSGGTTLTGSANNKSLSVVTCVYNGASSKIRVDGTETTGNAGTSGVAGFTVGSQYVASPGLYMAGEIAEMIVFNKLLTADEITVMETFLRSRVDFSPDMLGGMQGWWKADAITGLNDGDAVASWTDSSGNSRTLAQATAANRPTYKTNILNGKPVVRFDGSNDYLSATFGPIAQPGTIAVVAKSSTDGKFVVDGSQASNRWRIGSTSGNWFASAGTTLTGASNSQQFQQVVAVYNGASSKIRVDGTETTGAGGSDSAVGITVGSQYADSPAFYLSGDVAEIIMYNRALAAWEIALLEAYL